VNQQWANVIYSSQEQYTRCEAVSPGAGISLLTLRGKSLLSWAKAAHSSGHLLSRLRRSLKEMVEVVGSPSFEGKDDANL
jgi:hypothetical protein